MECNIKSSKVVIIFTVAIIILGGYFYYDFRSHEAIEAQISRLRQDVANVQPQQVYNTLAGQEAAKEEIVRQMISGRVKEINREIITLSGAVMTLEENKWVTGKELKEYKIAVSPSTKITDKGKTVGLKDIKIGDNLFVSGRIDLFRPDEVVAGMINVR